MTDRGKPKDRFKTSPAFANSRKRPKWRRLSRAYQRSGFLHQCKLSQQVRAGEMHLLQWARHLRRNRKSLKVTDPPFLGTKPKPQDEAHWRSQRAQIAKKRKRQKPSA